MAKANPFRFSTKYQDDETDVVYYGYRYYNTSTGRWLSRDPAEENAGENLYVITDNSPIGLVDGFGDRPLTIEFNAFIPGRLGQWLPEPIPWSDYEYESDNRDFGGGSSRVFARGTLETSLIGSYPTFVEFGNIGGSPSRRRRRGTQGPIEEKQARRHGAVDVIANPSPCQSVVETQGAGAYAFYPTLSPELRFRVTWTLTVTAPGEIQVTIGGGHGGFPNFEGLLDGSDAYKYDTPYSGPTPANLREDVHIAHPVITIHGDTPPCCPTKK